MILLMKLRLLKFFVNLEMIFFAIPAMIRLFKFI